MKKPGIATRLKNYERPPSYTAIVAIEVVYNEG